MSISNCGAVESYTALVEPTCFGGTGCDTCWLKFKNPPSYSLPWLKRYRQTEFIVMASLAKTTVENDTLIEKRSKLKYYMDCVESLTKDVHDLCPHLIENQTYTEWTNEDTYGRHHGPMHQQIQCKGCGGVLWRGTDK
jgi:hypothetical protein